MILGACDHAGTSKTAAATVTLRGMAFMPSVVEVHPGDTVVWNWENGGSSLSRMLRGRDETLATVAGAALERRLAGGSQKGDRHS